MGIKNKSVIGLELDSQEIRAVELKGTKKKPTAIAWGKAKLPEGIVKDGRVINPKLFAVELESLFNNNGFKGKDVILGVNNQDIIVRFASFPKVPEDKIRNMIRFQAQDYIPVSLDDLELDYIIVGEKKTEENEQLNVLLVGARKKMLNDFIEAFTAAKLDISEIDSTMLALGRSALIESSDGTFAFVGFNHDIGNIMIFKDGIIGMARSVSITQAPAWLESRQSEDADRDTEIIADILYGEIKSSVSYYKMQNASDIDKIFVLGSVSQQDFIATKFKNATGLDVIVPSPYKSIESINTKSNLTGFKASDYVAGISLALRGLGE